jgi:hypothetical protein
MSGIYSLVSINSDPKDSSKYILAISYNPRVLEDMMPAIKEIYSEDKGFNNILFEIEENTKIMEITKTVVLKPTPGSFIQPTEPGRAMLIPGTPGASAVESARTTLSLKLKTDFSSIRLPLYCTQLVSNKKVVDALLDLGEYKIERITEHFKNYVSSNPIMFDTLYEEGALNA